MLSPDLQRIEHIRDYCLYIEDAISFFGNSYETFCNNKTYQHSISFCILQIGELSGKLSRDYRCMTAGRIQWALVKGLRNIVAHDYGSVKLDELWEIIEADIPVLKAFCEEQLSHDEPTEPDVPS